MGRLQAILQNGGIQEISGEMLGNPNKRVPKMYKKIRSVYVTTAVM